MFSRRHPYLFSLLILLTVAGITILGVTFIVAIGTQRAEYTKGTSGEKVGVVEVTGIITDGKNVIQKLKRFREDHSIKAIVIRIDSPGGGVGPSQEIFREIRRTVKSKKVVASLGAVAASGGYYIAAGTDGIVANPGTITGSIGAIMGYANFQAILQKIGLVPVVVKSGEYKDMGSPAREMTDEEHKILQNFVNKIHGQFVRDVAEGRKMDPARVKALADGRIYTGEEAIELGLVDRLGNLEDSIEWAGRLAGIKGDVSAVYPREKRFSLLKYLTDSSLNEILDRAINPTLSAGYLYSPAGS